MDKKKVGLLGAILALIAGIALTSVAWAFYTTPLIVNGAGGVSGAKWEIKFSRLATVSQSQTATLGNDDTGVTSTATETSAPTIKNDTTIGDYVVNLTTPGDFASYEFDITNNGTFDALVATGWSLPTPNCAPATNSEATQTEATTTCGKLSYTLTYVDAPDHDNKGPAANASVQAGDLLEAGETRTVLLKLYYNKNTTQAQLPSDDIAVSNLGFTLTYNQK